MQLKIPVIGKGSADLVGIKSEAGGDVTIAIKGTGPAMLAGHELPLRLSREEFERLLRGLQGIADDRARAKTG